MSSIFCIISPLSTKRWFYLIRNIFISNFEEIQKQKLFDCAFIAFRNWFAVLSALQSLLKHVGALLFHNIPFSSSTQRVVGDPTSRKFLGSLHSNRHSEFKKRPSEQDTFAFVGVRGKSEHFFP